MAGSLPRLAFRSGSSLPSAAHERGGVAAASIIIMFVEGPIPSPPPGALHVRRKGSGLIFFKWSGLSSEHAPVWAGERGYKRRDAPPGAQASERGKQAAGRERGLGGGEALRSGGLAESALPPDAAFPVGSRGSPGNSRQRRASAAFPRFWRPVLSAEGRSARAGD